MPHDPAPFRDTAATAARYLAGLGYSAAEIRSSLMERQGVTGWRTSDISAAAKRESSRAKSMRAALSADPMGTLPRSLAGHNENIQAAYRYGILYTFGDGELRTIIVNSSRLLDMSDLIQQGKFAWADREGGSPQGRLAEYDPTKADAVSVITFERRS